MAEPGNRQHCGSLGLDTASRLGSSIQFFFYDVIKIMVLLGVLILIISYIQSYFPPERTKRILGRLHGIGPSCGRVMVSDGHSVQAALVGFTNHIIRRLAAIGEHRVAVQIPSGGRRSIGNTRKSHTTIVS